MRAQVTLNFLGAVHANNDTVSLQLPTTVPAALNMSGFNDRLVWFGLHEKAGVSVTPEHIHPHGVKELTAQSSYLIHVVSFPLDQYCLYKGSDLSVMALPTNWLSRGAGGVSLRATFCYNTSSMNKRKCPPTPHPLYIISPILGGN